LAHCEATTTNTADLYTDLYALELPIGKPWNARVSHGVEVLKHSQQRHDSPPRRRSAPHAPGKAASPPPSPAPAQRSPPPPPQLPPSSQQSPPRDLRQPRQKLSPPGRSKRGRGRGVTHGSPHKRAALLIQPQLRRR